MFQNIFCLKILYIMYDCMIIAQQNYCDVVKILENILLSWLIVDVRQYFSHISI